MKQRIKLAKTAIGGLAGRTRLILTTGYIEAFTTHFNEKPESQRQLYYPYRCANMLVGYGTYTLGCNCKALKSLGYNVLPLFERFNSETNPLNPCTQTAPGVARS